MRGTAAKKIRRELRRATMQPTRYDRDARGTVRCSGWRDIVQQAKKFWKTLTHKQKKKAAR